MPRMSQPEFPTSDTAGTPEAQLETQDYSQVFRPPRGSPTASQQRGALSTAVVGAAEPQSNNAEAPPKQLTGRPAAYGDGRDGGGPPWYDPSGSTVSGASWGGAASPHLDTQQSSRPLMKNPAIPGEEGPSFGGSMIQRPLSVSGEASGSLGSSAAHHAAAASADGEQTSQWGAPTTPVGPWTGGGPSAASSSAAASPASTPTPISLSEASQQQQQQQEFLGAEASGGSPQPGGGAPEVARTSAVPGVAYDMAEGKWQVKWSQGGRFYTKSFPVSRFGFNKAQALAEGYKGPLEGPLNPAAAVQDFPPQPSQEGPSQQQQQRHQQQQLSQEGGVPLQLQSPDPFMLPPDPDDLSFSGSPVDVAAAAKGASTLAAEGPQQRAPAAGGSKRESSAPQRSAPRPLAAAQQQRQQQQQQLFLQLQQDMQPQDGMGCVNSGALQGTWGPPMLSDVQHQQGGPPFPLKNPMGACGGPAAPWLCFSGLGSAAQGVGMHDPMRPQWASAGWGPCAPQPLRGPPFSAAVAGGALPGVQRGQGDCLLSTAAAQQHSLLAIKAFLLACDEAVAPPWKQLASWAPWLSGQQQGPPHVGPPMQLLQHTESERQRVRVGGGPPKETQESPAPPELGGPLEDLQEGGATVETELRPPPTVIVQEALEELPMKGDRKRKKGGGTQAAAATKKAAKSPRVSAGGQTLPKTQELYKEDVLQCCVSPALPLTAVQQADLCLELVMALGRLRTAWRVRGNRIPYHLHVARLRPSLLLPATPPNAAVLAAYREALGPLVAHIGDLQYVHLGPGEADEVVREVEMLRGPAAIDSVLKALDAMGPWGHENNLDLPPDAEALEAEAMRDAGDRRQQLLQQHQQQQQQPNETPRASEAPAEGPRGAGDSEVLLAYNPDLKSLRQLNYLVPGTRVYVHLDVIEAKLAEMGLPPLPPQPAGTGEGGAPSASRGPLSKFVMAEAGERHFTVPYGEYLPLKLVGPPQHVLEFSVGRAVQLLQEGRLCLLRFTEREALKRRLPLLGGPLGAPNDPAGAAGSGGPLGYKHPRGTKPACCPAPIGIEKICRCKCNHRRQELYGQLKQKLRTDRKGCLAILKEYPDLNHVAFNLPSARTYQLEILSYLFGVDPWLYAKNRQEAPPAAEIPGLVRRYKELVNSKEYEQAFKHWVEEQAREKCLQQEITADITAIGLNLKDTTDGASSAGGGAAHAAQQDPRVQASIVQLTPNTPICVRVKALLGLPSGNEQHLRGVVRRVQLLPKGRAISISINNRREEFVLLPDELEALVAHDDLRLVRMRSRQWFAYEAQGSAGTGSSTAGRDSQWGVGSTQDEVWRDDIQSTAG